MPGDAGTIGFVPDHPKDPAGDREADSAGGGVLRARRQLLLGIAPLSLIGLVLLAVLALALPTARAPLSAATQTTTAEVVRSGVAPSGRGVEVAFTDDAGEEVTGVVVLARPDDVPAGIEIGVQYDPDDPESVYADGDAAHLAVRNLLFGLVWVGLVLAICVVVTALRLVSRPRLARRVATEATARRVRVRRGLSDRTWLILEHDATTSWVPVYWDKALVALHRDTPIMVHGNPRRDRLVLPVVDGSSIWPSGGLRTTTPKGIASQPSPRDSVPVGTLLRQARGDAAGVFFAPLFGLLWAYTDESGVSGFLVATALSAGVLFWLPSIFGSDPTDPREDE